MVAADWIETAAACVAAANESRSGRTALKNWKTEAVDEDAQPFDIETVDDFQRMWGIG